MCLKAAIGKLTGMGDMTRAREEQVGDRPACFFTSAAVITQDTFPIVNESPCRCFSETNLTLPVWLVAEGHSASDLLEMDVMKWIGRDVNIVSLLERSVCTRRQAASRSRVRPARWVRHDNHLPDCSPAAWRPSAQSGVGGATYV